MRHGEPINFFSKPDNSNPQVINGREYLEGYTIRTVEEHPYSYTPFYIARAKEFKELNHKGKWAHSEQMMADNYPQYGWARQHATQGKVKFFEDYTNEMYEIFVRVFFGQNMKWLATANGRSPATGNDYYLFLVM